MRQGKIFFGVVIMALAGLVCPIGGASIAQQAPAGAAKPSPRREAGKKMEKNMEKQPAKESPFACNLTALNVEQRRRLQTLSKQLGAARQEIRELADGYAFRLPAEPSLIRDLAEWITLERLCCPFFNFELEVEREGGPLWLRLTGREGVKQFIRIEFSL